jgi:hypothetical protein
MLLLVPADPLRPRRAEGHFAAEAAAARDAGVTVALIDHDALADPGPGGAGRAVALVPDSGGTAVYRGWMLRASQYAALAAACPRGACCFATTHTPDDRPPDIDLSPFTPLIRSLGLPFVTADLARRADGTWRVIELGDGQVSDRPATIEPDTFLEAILART